QVDGRWRARWMPTRTAAMSSARSRAATRTLAEALPRARHRTLTGQTHEVAPQVLAPVLADFFARDVYTRQAS
ncbi:hypothetical protein I3W98_28100, partial [Streptomyces cavourensis]|nr:hypothetical protein [Streptomyces cavourensis]